MRGPVSLGQLLNGSGTDVGTVLDVASPGLGKRSLDDLRMLGLYSDKTHEHQLSVAYERAGRDVPWTRWRRM